MKKTAKQKQSQAFLCLLLASIILFVASVCLFINKRNEKIAGNTVSETIGTGETENKEKNEKEQNNQDESKVVSEPESTSEPTKESSPQTTVEETSNEETSNASSPDKLSTPKIISISEEKWYLTLVNTGFRIPDDYSPDLVYVCGSGEQLDSKVAVHYEKMYNAALEDGVTLTPCSGYRSYELQERNYNNKTAFYETLGYSHDEALVKAATIIMPPGSSEHNLGYAMDIVCVEEWFEDTAEFKWLNENAADYGFILRYPSDKTNITKVTYEPWHWRYVGVEDAKAIKASGQVLEEYLGIS